MKGILFKPDLIKAIVEGRKTQTRRLAGLNEINESPDSWKYRGSGIAIGKHFFEVFEVPETTTCHSYLKPRYQVGETVYIKEAWADMVCVASTEKGKGKGESRPIYKSTADSTELKILEGHWKSPMFMPVWAARYFIKITDVRVERLQEITPEDCRREGSYMATDKDDEGGFVNLWDSINPKYPWASNPYVFVYSFEKLDKLVGIAL
jgi:hypothetical protein